MFGQNNNASSMFGGSSSNNANSLSGSNTFGSTSSFGLPSGTFGGSSSSTFGQPQSNSNLFGSSSGSGGFGSSGSRSFDFFGSNTSSNNAPSGGSGFFGSSTNRGSDSFGSSQSNQSGGNFFGSGMFSQPNNNNSGGGGFFGSGTGSNTSSFGTSGTGSSFGSSSFFGKPSNSSSTNTNQGFFGGNPSSSLGTTSSGNFGSSGMFGTSSTGDTFGSAEKAFFSGNQSSSIPSTGTSGGFFGSGTSGGMFGSGSSNSNSTNTNQSQLIGTKSFPYKITSNAAQKIDYISICAMPEYEHKSNEELRFEDLTNQFASDKTKEVSSKKLQTGLSASGASGLFGTNTTQNTGSNIFGSSSSGNFGGSGMFGTDSLNSSSSLSNTSGTSTGNFFGSGGSSQNTTGSGGFATSFFGSNPSNSSSFFGSSGKESNPFETKPSINSSNLFGTGNSNTSGSNFFGTSTSTPAQTNNSAGVPLFNRSLFGFKNDSGTSSSNNSFGQSNSNTKSSFGGSSFFGGNDTSSKTSFGGQSSFGTSNNLFGNNSSTASGGNSSSLFGNSSSFGTSNASSTNNDIFGKPNSSSFLGSSFFGSGNQSSNSGGNLFGSASSNTQGSGLFGSNNTSQNNQGISFNSSQGFRYQNESINNNSEAIMRKKVLLQTITDALKTVDPSKDPERIFEAVLNTDFNQFFVNDEQGFHFLDLNPNTNETSTNQAGNLLFGSNTNNSNASKANLFGSNTNTSNGSNTVNSFFGTNTGSNTANSNSGIGSGNLFGTNTSSGSSLNSGSNLFGTESNTTNNTTGGNLFGTNSGTSTIGGILNSEKNFFGTNANSTTGSNSGSNLPDPNNNAVVTDPYGFGIAFTKAALKSYNPHKPLSSFPGDFGGIPNGILRSSDRFTGTCIHKEATGSLTATVSKILGEEKMREKNDSEQIVLQMINEDRENRNKTLDTKNQTKKPEENTKKTEQPIFTSLTKEESELVEKLCGEDPAGIKLDLTSEFDSALFNDHGAKQTESDLNKKEADNEVKQEELDKNKEEGLKDQPELDKNKEEVKVKEKIKLKPGVFVSENPTEENNSGPNIQKTKNKTPILSKKGYWALPISFQNIPRSEVIPSQRLKRVENLSIGNKHGIIAWKYPIDCRNINFDETVKIVPGNAEVYLDESKKPPVGYGLNKPAKITLFDIKPNKKLVNKKGVSEASKIFKKSLREKLQLQDPGAHLISWDYSSKTAVFTVEHFSKYSLTEENNEKENDEKGVENKNLNLHKFKNKRMCTDHPSRCNNANFALRMSGMTRPCFSADGRVLYSPSRRAINIVDLKKLEKKTSVNFTEIPPENPKISEMSDLSELNKLMLKNFVDLLKLLWVPSNEKHRLINFEIWLRKNLQIFSERKQKICSEERKDVMASRFFCKNEMAKCVENYAQYKERNALLLDFLFSYFKVSSPNKIKKRKSIIKKFSKEILPSFDILSTAEKLICAPFLYIFLSLDWYREGQSPIQNKPKTFNLFNLNKSSEDIKNQFKIIKRKPSKEEIKIEKNKSKFLRVIRDEATLPERLGLFIWYIKPIEYSHNKSPDLTRVLKNFFGLEQMQNFEKSIFGKTKKIKTSKTDKVQKSGKIKNPQEGSHISPLQPFEAVLRLYGLRERFVRYPYNRRMALIRQILDADLTLAKGDFILEIFTALFEPSSHCFDGIFGFFAREDMDEIEEMWGFCEDNFSDMEPDFEEREREKKLNLFMRTMDPFLIRLFSFIANNREDSQSSLIKVMNVFFEKLNSTGEFWHSNGKKFMSFLEENSFFEKFLGIMRPDDENKIYLKFLKKKEKDLDGLNSLSPQFRNSIITNLERIRRLKQGKRSERKIENKMVL